MIIKIAKNSRLVGSLSILAVIVLGLYFSLAFKGIDTKTLLDTTFNFSSTHLYNTLDGYTAVQRSHYLIAEMIDFVVMIFVSFIEALIIAKAFETLRGGGKLYVVPIIAAILNGLKDVAMIAILLQVPQELHSLADVTNGLNMAKTIFVDLSLGLVLAAAVILFVHRKPKKL